jgi:para-nitrobenzyl esterase
MITYILVALVLLGAASAAELPLNVTTTEGIAGGSLSFGARAWFNLPFAKPPINELRFRAPEPPSDYPGGYRDATAYESKKCRVLGDGESTEDCLYLDIAAPVEDDPVNYPNGYPVMVWIHGGALISGSKNEYEGISLSSTIMLLK